MKKAEIYLALLALLALIFKLTLIPGAGIVTMLSLSILGMMYYFLGFALFNGIKLRAILKSSSYTNITAAKIIGAVLTGWVLSMALIGIMFRLQLYPGGHNLLFLGLIGMMAIIVVSIIARLIAGQSRIFPRILKRIAVVAAVSALLYITPTDTLLDLQHRNNPEYRDALKNAMANPDNEQYQEKLEEEREKLYQAR